MKHCKGYIFQFGKNTKTSKQSKPKSPINLYPFTENKKLRLCHHNDSYFNKAKERNSVMNFELSELLILLQIKLFYLDDSLWNL